MADNNRVIVELGRVIQDRGEWNDLPQDAKLYLQNIVQYNKNTYRVKVVPAVGYITKDVLPTDTTYYTVFAGVGEVATGSDFDAPSAAQRDKITTVGAVLDGMNDGVYNLTAKTGDSYATLSDALIAANNTIPTNKKRGGMSICFVKSSDNKYVQYRLMAQSFITDVTKWQGVDDEPTPESDNLVKSRGVVRNTNNSIALIEGYIGKSLVYTFQKGYLNENGEYAGRSTYDSKTTGLIPCEEGDIFMYKGFANTGAVSSLFFNDSKEIIGNTHQVGYNYIEITIPANTKFVQFSSCNTIDSTVTLEVYKKGNFEERINDLEQKDVELQNSILAEAQERKSELDKFVDIANPWPNYYNPDEEKENTVISSDGTETVNTKYTLNEEYIPVNNGQYISVKGSTEETGNGVAYIAYYDENKEYISRSRTPTQTNAVYNIQIGPTIKYTRICIWKGSTDVALYVNDENPGYTLNNWNYTSYGAHAALIKPEALPNGIYEAAEELDFEYREKDITDKNVNYFTSAFINDRGQIVASSSWWVGIIQLSDIDNYSEIIIKSNTASTIRLQAAFYSTENPVDSDFITGYNFTAPSSATLVIKASDIPANAVSLLLPNYILGGGTLQVLLKSSKETSRLDVLEDNQNSIKNLMLRERRAAFDNKFNSIAYSAMAASNMAPNCEEYYNWCAQREYTALKGDVRISSDGEIVMCHDEGFTFNSDGEIIAFDIDNMTPIRSMTVAENFALIYAGTNEHVCGINSLLRNCKIYGKIAFITIRSSYLDEIIPKVLDALDRYGLRERAILNGFSYETMKFIRRYDENIMLSWVQTYNHQVTTDDVDKANALGNCLISCYDYSGTNPTTHTNQSDFVLQYARSKNVRMYEAVVYQAELLTNEFYDRGFVGCQIGFELPLS